MTHSRRSIEKRIEDLESDDLAAEDPAALTVTIRDTVVPGDWDGDATDAEQIAEQTVEVPVRGGSS